MEKHDKKVLTFAENAHNVKIQKWNLNIVYYDVTRQRVY